MRDEKVKEKQELLFEAGIIIMLVRRLKAYLLLKTKGTEGDTAGCS